MRPIYLLTLLAAGLSAASPESVTIRIDATRTIRKIPPALYGTNHRFFNDGVGTYDPAAGRMKPEFTAVHKRAGLKSIRYPGGTMANPFEWKKAIGPVSGRGKIHRTDGKAVWHPAMQVAFGVDECARWARENGVEMVYMYNMANGSAADAADLIEYLNAPVGTNPNGGVAWADVRAKNGSPAPYGIRYFEIGNEMNGPSQTFWLPYIEGPVKAPVTTFRQSLNAFAREYSFGGYAVFHNQFVGVPDDYRPTASYGDGKPDQVKQVRMYGVEPGSDTVFVDGVPWTRVADIGKPDGRSYQIDPKTGVIRFGEGASAPPEGSLITISFKTRRDGFVDYYRAMKLVDPAIRIHVGYESLKIAEVMGDEHPYDGIVVHPYTKQSHFSKDMTPDEFHHRLMYLADVRAREVGEYIETMKKHSGRDLETPITEYGLIQLDQTPFTSKPDYMRSLDQALYVGQSLMHFMRLGVPHAEKHATIGGNDAVFGEAPDFVYTATANVFELFTSMFGQELLGASVEGNPVRVLRDGSKLARLDAVASCGADGALYAIVINRDAREAQSAALRIDGGGATGPAEVWTVKGDTYTAFNSKEKPDAVRIVKEKKAAGAPFAHVFPPHSITAIRMAAR